MSAYNYLLLLVPVVGIAMLLGGFYWMDRSRPGDHPQPGE